MLGWLMSLAIVRTECFDGCFFFSPHFSVGFLMSSSKGHLHSSIFKGMSMRLPLLPSVSPASLVGCLGAKAVGTELDQCSI